MATPFLAEIRLFSFNFAPHGWAACDGQLLPINQNTALFSLLGTQFGGNGTSNFALPDLRGRVAVGAQNQGTGLQVWNVGEQQGTEVITLTGGQMPVHTHAVTTTNSTATSDSPTSAALASPNVAARFKDLYRADKNGVAAGSLVGMSGGNQPHENRQPFTVLFHAIALNGIFPSR